MSGRHIALFSALSLLPWLAACGGGAPPPRSQSQNDYLACRSLADTTYEKQNRGDFIRPDNRDSPFAGSGTGGNTSAGLSQRFGRDNDIASCVRGSAANVSGSNVAAPHAP